jgi:hypothetical protein
MFPRTEKSNSSKDFSAGANIEEPRYVTFPLTAYDLAIRFSCDCSIRSAQQKGGQEARRSSI